MIGFSFRGVHSSTFNIGVRSVDRSLIPQLRKNEFTIPGRHGTIDMGSNTYEKRPITVMIVLVKNTDWFELRKNARMVAQWLSGKGRLIFDDEPDKMYDASVYEYMGVEQYHVMPVSEGEIVFECQPFAESPDYKQLYTPGVTQNNKTVSLMVAGTIETCCVISIKNTGNTNINNIILRRKAEI